MKVRQQKLQKMENKKMGKGRGNFFHRINFNCRNN